MTKLLENIFRSVNIALVNELAMLCDRMGIDVWEVVDAAATKPFGFMRFEPGPGMGGHCLPVDPFYLAFKAREYDFPPEFIELAGKVNQQQPHFCVERIVRALNDVGKPVRGSRVLILGVSYKAGVGDLRESPALKIIHLLRGARRRGHLPRPARRRGRRARPRVGELADGARRLRRRLHHHRAPRGRLRRVVAEAPLVVDFRGVTRGIEADEPDPALAVLGPGRNVASVFGRVDRARPAPTGSRSALAALARRDGGHRARRPGRRRIERAGDRRGRATERRASVLETAEHALGAATQATQDTVTVAIEGYDVDAARRDDPVQPAQRVHRRRSR